MLRHLYHNPSTGLVVLAVLMLLTAVISGVMASLSYLIPDFWLTHGGFAVLRPWHVSAALFWILSGATGLMHTALRKINPGSTLKPVAQMHLLLWVFGIAGVFFSYTNRQFGGREYWEFDPIWSLPLAVAWVLHIFLYLKQIPAPGKWPVYYWMWLSGSLFFLFIFGENYLWMIPGFRENLIRDMTIQWKVNGSLVGAWNQMIYGTSFFLMEKIGRDDKVAHSRMAFLMYFLGMLNLMFNWGHHIYTLPTEPYVRIVAYSVSMTEWIFLARIIFSWKQSLKTAQQHYPFFPYRFLMAADFWILISMAHAICLSIPALNLYTHGTHITVAHAMGTTIGINSMILLSGLYYFFMGDEKEHAFPRWLNGTFWMTQAALLIFWISLNGAGIIRGLWMHLPKRTPFLQMMESAKPWFGVFALSGTLLMSGLILLSIFPLLQYFKHKRYESENSIPER